ncbi:MAG TPA: amino acid permease [Flavobacteriales bacterium]|nr:amino acid permease [Flavobacteriales bacterium]HMR28685.1 amino acid permease [Flavobacteriales bacterium]
MNATGTSLHRALGLWDAVGVGLGAIIGAGIFVVTGEAAGVAGPAFLVGLGIAGAVAAFNGISSAQLAAVYPYSGGTYEYGHRLLGPVWGFSAGWMFVASKLSAAGVVALGFGAYAHALLPKVPAMALSVGAVVLLTLANILGIRKAGTLNLLIVGITLLVLLYFSVGGLSQVSRDHFVPFAPTGWTGVLTSAALLFFAFTGYARIATLAEEVRDPKRTIPRAVIITIAVAIVLYALVAFVAVGTIGAPAMAATNAPLQAAASAMDLPGIGILILLAAATAMLGVLLSQVLGISRMLLAMGRRHDLPPALARIHSRRKVPIVAIVLTGGIILAMVLFGTIGFILRTATFTILLYYAITNIAALKQPGNEQQYGRWVPALGLVGCVVMAASLSGQTVLYGIGVLLVGLLFRAAMHRLFGPATNTTDA